MTVPIYTPRVTNEAGVITAWIDKDNALCIEQPNHPTLVGTGLSWESEADALTWAEAHAEQLRQYAIETEEKEAAAAEAVVAEAAARQAILDNASKISEIHAMLTALTQG
jgi:hypothetical protein